MQSQEQENPKLILWILWFALFNSQFIFLGVGHFVLFKGLEMAPLSSIHYIFFAIALVIAFVTEKFYRNAAQVSAKAFNPATPVEEGKELLKKAHVSYVLTWALGESISILGLILPMIGGAGYIQYGYGLMASGVCLHFYRMPKVK